MVLRVAVIVCYSVLLRIGEAEGVGEGVCHFDGCSGCDSSEPMGKAAFLFYNNVYVGFRISHFHINMSLSSR